MKTDLLHSILMDVRDKGSTCIEKRKLLWMLDRQNESASAWAKLLEEWAEVGGEKDALRGFEWGGCITLTATKTNNIQELWAA
jgi:dienelactone hydrolase